MNDSEPMPEPQVPVPDEGATTLSNKDVLSDMPDALFIVKYDDHAGRVFYWRIGSRWLEDPAQASPMTYDEATRAAAVWNKYKEGDHYTAEPVPAPVAESLDSKDFLDQVDARGYILVMTYGGPGYTGVVRYYSSRGGHDNAFWATDPKQATPMPLAKAEELKQKYTDPHADANSLNSVYTVEPAFLDEALDPKDFLDSMSQLMDLDAFFSGYVECALWGSTDNADDSGGSPLEDHYTIDNIEPETLAQMRQDCERFIEVNREHLASADYRRHDGYKYTDAEMAGHDFWLTRNGSGTGFWDREELPEEVAKALTDSAHRFGEYDLTVNFTNADEEGYLLLDDDEKPLYDPENDTISGYGKDSSTIFESLDPLLQALPNARYYVVFDIPGRRLYWSGNESPSSVGSYSRKPTSMSAVSLEAAQRALAQAKTNLAASGCTEPTIVPDVDAFNVQEASKPAQVAGVLLEAMDPKDFLSQMPACDDWRAVYTGVDGKVLSWMDLPHMTRKDAYAEAMSHKRQWPKHVTLEFGLARDIAAPGVVTESLSDKDLIDTLSLPMEWAVTFKTLGGDTVYLRWLSNMKLWLTADDVYQATTMPEELALKVARKLDADAGRSPEEARFGIEQVPVAQEMPADKEQEVRASQLQTESDAKDLLLQAPEMYQTWRIFGTDGEGQRGYYAGNYRWVKSAKSAQVYTEKELASRLATYLAQHPESQGHTDLGVEPVIFSLGPEGYWCQESVSAKDLLMDMPDKCIIVATSRNTGAKYYVGAKPMSGFVTRDEAAPFSLDQASAVMQEYNALDDSDFFEYSIEPYEEAGALAAVSESFAAKDLLMGMPFTVKGVCEDFGLRLKRETRIGAETDAPTQEWLTRSDTELHQELDGSLPLPSPIGPDKEVRVNVSYWCAKPGREVNGKGHRVRIYVLGRQKNLAAASEADLAATLESRLKSLRYALSTMRSTKPERLIRVIQSLGYLYR